MIKSEIVADSISSKGHRLTTFVLEYPRMVHSELMTHRVFSKNSASSRAIPFEKFVQTIKENPAMPEFWGKNQSGMQALEELDDKIKKHGSASWQSEPVFTDKEYAKVLWLDARDNAIKEATKLYELGVHKQIVNRILEPWFHIRIILSGTEFGNWFALRAHKDAQPEIQALAHSMLKNYNDSTPKICKVGDWHIPFGDKIDSERLLPLANEFFKLNNIAFWSEAENQLKIKIAIARCARVSYYNFEGKDDYEADIKLCDRLFGNNPKHLSPTEHVAQAIDGSEFIGNFRGWRQYRKFFQDENLSDGRVLSKISV